MKVKTYDESTGMTVKRGGKGLYTITLPWVLGADNYMVMLSGRWSTMDKTPIYATIKSQSSSEFTVQTQDDDSANDGSFNFMVIGTVDFK